MSDLDALREDFNVAHSTGVEIGKSAVAVIRDLQADNERLREERDELAHQLKVAMGETSLRDESIKTLVLFFAEDAERQEFVELVKEAKPGMIERTIPSYPTKSDATLNSMILGLHAMLFGESSQQDPDHALASISDGGEIHEFVHEMVRLLPDTQHPGSADVKERTNWRY